VRRGVSARARDYAALVAFIDSRQNVPHAWGRRANDCAGYALDAVAAQVGFDRAADLDWSDRSEGLRVIARFGTILPDPSNPTAVGGLEAAFDHYFVRIPPAHAQRGDIAGVPDATFGIHPMIVEGLQLVGPGDRGNRRQPRKAMTIAWSAVLPKPAEPAKPKPKPKTKKRKPNNPTGAGK
jgi:hypothetical protein